jgi:hypothetical protein
MDDKREMPPAGARPRPVRARRVRQGVDPISAGLRALWASLENDPVPEEFLSLLERIDAEREAASGTVLREEPEA